MGLPLAQIRTMPEKDLQAYVAYAAECMLPHRRFELQLAQLTHWVAGCMGGYKGKMTDFLIGAEKTETETETDDVLDWDGNFTA